MQELAGEEVLVKPEQMGNYIVSIAEGYVGEMEIPGNSGFKSRIFEVDMRSVGWQPGYSWCAYFAKLVWLHCYHSAPKHVETLKKLMVGGAVATFNNFKEQSEPKHFQVAGIPAPGALVVWQHVGSWQGHIGLVKETANFGFFSTIEGNTSVNGGRNGDRVAEHGHSLNEVNAKTGLRLLGFVYPCNHQPTDLV